MKFYNMSAFRICNIFKTQHPRIIEHQMGIEIRTENRDAIVKILIATT